jgi:hypothetical protein
MRAAWKVTTPEEREERLEQLARFLERDYESAARSLREGMAEMFTLQRLKLPPLLWALATILGRKAETEISQEKVTYMKVPSSVFQLLHGISSALDNHSIRWFANTVTDFSITEV